MKSIHKINLSFLSRYTWSGHFIYINYSWAIIKGVTMVNLEDTIAVSFSSINRRFFRLRTHLVPGQKRVLDYFLCLSKIRSPSGLNHRYPFLFFFFFSNSLCRYFWIYKAEVPSKCTFLIRYTSFFFSFKIKY